MYKIKFFPVLVIIVFCSVVAYCEEQLKNKPWYKYAEEYVQADEAMIQNAIEKKGTFLEDYDSRYKAELQLFKSPAPTAPEIEKLLKSSNVIDRKVALVNVSVKQIYSESLFKIIFKHYSPKDDFFIKFYTYQCFKFLDRDKIKLFEDNLLKIISLEDNDSIIIGAMPILIRLERSKIIPLFVGYLKSNDRGIRMASYIYLKKTDEKYLNDVKKLLEKENSADALNFIKDMESGKKP